MTASYGRPQTRQVNALPQVTKASPAKPMSFDAAPQGQNGRFLDYSSAEQAGLNAARPYTELANFIEAATEPTIKAAKLYVKDQVDEELGKIAAQPEMLQAYRQGGEKERDWISSFRPQTQKIVNEAWASSEAGAYNERLIAAETTSDILTGTLASEQERDAERQRIKGEVYEATLGKVPVAYQGGVLDLVMLAEAGSRAKVEELRLKEKRQEDDSKLAAGLGDELRRGIAERSTVIGKTQLEADQEAIRIVGTQLGAINAEKTTQQTAGFAVQAVSNEVTKVLGKDFKDAEGAVNIIDNALAIYSSLEMDNGQSLLDVRLADGETVQAKLEKARSTLGPAAEEQQKEQDRVLSGQIIIEGTGPNATDAQKQQAQAQLTQLLKGDPDLLFQRLAQLEQIDSIYDQPTDKQQETELNLLAGWAGKALSIKEKLDQIADADLTNKQKLTLAKAARGDEDNVTQAINYSVSKTNRAQVTSATQTVFTEANKTGSPKTVQQVEADLLRETNRRTYKQVQEYLQNPKNTLDQATVDGFFQKNLQDVANEQVAGYVKSNVPVKSNVQNAGDLLTEVATRYREQGFKKSVNIFPQTFRDRAKELGYNPDSYYDLQRAMSQYLGDIQENGKPAFPSPRKTWQQTLQNAMSYSGQPPSGQGAQEQESKPAQAAAPLPSQQALQESLNMMNWMIAGGATKPQSIPQQIEMILPTGLYQMAGGSGIPSQEPKLDNLENIQALASLAGQKKRLQANTPPLPQLPPDQPTVLVPTNISNDKHPYFLAVGIANGTRTSKGGYTNLWQREGTAGRRNGLTPAQSDNAVAGQMSQTLTRITPVLQQMGLKPGTAGWNRLMFNVLDMSVSSPPEAFTGFIQNLPQLQDFSIEGIAKARAEWLGTQSNFSEIYSMMRSRAGVFDYRRKL